MTVLPAPAGTQTYDEFARRVVESGILLDPWLDGEPRLSMTPLVLGPHRYRDLARAGEDVAELYNEACLLVEDDDELLENFFGLSPVQQLMWNVSRPLWHGLARADVFETHEGYVISELNCDTPTGEAEAVVLGELSARDHPELVDPNRNLEPRFGAMVEILMDRLLDRPFKKVIGIVYPTEFTEDLSVIRLYRKWLEKAGFEVVLGSPYNLGADGEGRATLFGRPIFAMLRHYKTDGWGERVSAWDDETLPDSLPLGAPLSVALKASVERKTAVINPFGAVVPQNKRIMAFMWEHIHRFSTRARALIEKYVPYTSRLETIHQERVLADREGWVLKSDYGAEGEEVIIGRLTDEKTWAESVKHARPGRWVAQRYFEALGEGMEDGAGQGKEQTEAAPGVSPSPVSGVQPLNYGVFLVGGQASGLYVRRQAGATDDHAVSVPVLVRPPAPPAREETPRTPA